MCASRTHAKAKPSPVRIRWTAFMHHRCNNATCSVLNNIICRLRMTKIKFWLGCACVCPGSMGKYTCLLISEHVLIWCMHTCNNASRSNLYKSICVGFRTFELEALLHLHVHEISLHYKLSWSFTFPMSWICTCAPNPALSHLKFTNGLINLSLKHMQM